MGHHGQPLRGVFQQGNIRGLWGIDKPGQHGAQFRLVFHPMRIVARPDTGVFLGELLYGQTGALRPGRHGGMIQIDDVFIELEFLLDQFFKAHVCLFFMVKIGYSVPRFVSGPVPYWCTWRSRRAPRVHNELQACQQVIEM